MPPAGWVGRRVVADCFDDGECLSGPGPPGASQLTAVRYHLNEKVQQTFKQALSAVSRHFGDPMFRTPR
jgi:hypothetical protein